jgi:DNA repair exonuclease SbcCD nuclease subunit
MIGMLGDVHNFIRVIPLFERTGITGFDVIQVGDFGTNGKTSDAALLELNEELKKINVRLHVIRGNHDNPLLFKGGHRLSHLDLIPDYTVKKIAGINFLFVGGAISIDRKPNHNIPDPNSPSKTWEGLTEGLNYWKEEKFHLNSEMLSTFVGIEAVVTHNAPNIVPPLLGLKNADSFKLCDPTLLEEISKEREDLTTMMTILEKRNEIRYWAYGHFHFSNTSYYNNIKFHLLGEMELAEVRL